MKDLASRTYMTSPEFVLERCKVIHGRKQRDLGTGPDREPEAQSTVRGSGVSLKLKGFLQKKTKFLYYIAHEYSFLIHICKPF